MNKFLFLLFFAITLTGCASQAEQHYIKSNLKDIYTGQSKQQFLNVFPGQKIRVGTPPIQMPAAQKNNKKLIEIGEVLMAGGTVSHWFLFEDGALAQWGTPADWKEIKSPYEINYNPSIGLTD